MADATPAELLDAYDTQLRGEPPARLPAGVEVERDGPLLRYLGYDGHGFVDYRELGHLEGAALDALIARQVRVFAGRGEAFEWKLRAHDRPPDLDRRLRAAGFVPSPTETVMIAPVGRASTEPRLPPGVSLRASAERRDLDRIETMETAIRGHDDRHRLAEALEAELAVDGDGLCVLLAEVDEVVVAAGWVRFERGTEFATLWGGATLPAWRGRGVYRALVAARARLAAERGFAYLEVDASDASRPILARIGFLAVTTTTPFIWSPPPARDAEAAQTEPAP